MYQNAEEDKQVQKVAEVETREGKEKEVVEEVAEEEGEVEEEAGQP